MSNTVLVTGAAGFVGSHLTRALLERGAAVVALDLADRLPQFVTNGLDSPPVTYIVGDVSDSHQIASAVLQFGVTDIVHTAASLAEPESILRPRHFLKVNAESVWALCDIARSLPIRRLVAVSTRSVYGTHSPEGGPVNEEASPRPVAFYGASKAAADIVAVQYAKHFDLDLVIPRVTGAYGPHQSYPQFLSDMIDAAVRGEAFHRDVGGDSQTEVTYVKDIVRGLLALLDAATLRHTIYNVGSGMQVSLSELAHIVQTFVPEADIEIGPGLDPAAAPRALSKCLEMVTMRGSIAMGGVRVSVQVVVS
ncbi:SDR family oxidoreductase [Rhodococcus sp. NPDC019627]|uniref:NAD-dependent epimerase/dehydratase family protein n=1 Tax=unclassified Rhodococcus (in: high G+C Gram-positive bacteria) TaxID=192944 RepID=UPI00340D5FFC